jgi:hypothetical protein
MFGDVTIFDAVSVSVIDQHFFEPSDSHPKGFCSMRLQVRNAAGETFNLNLFTSGADAIAFSAPALELRGCAECGQLMPREYHPRVKVCSACETSGPPSEGPDVGAPVGLVNETGF